jgi:hypothetical protein
MECLPAEKILEGDFWTYGLKLDGCRLEAREAGRQGYPQFPSRWERSVPRWIKKPSSARQLHYSCQSRISWSRRAEPRSSVPHA